MRGQGIAAATGVGRWSGATWRGAAWRGRAAAATSLAALVLLGACSSSPPTHFYTLSDTAPDAVAPAGVGWVRIVNLTIPGELDRPELVRRVGPNQLSVAGFDRWAAPLDETIRRTLADDIARRVPAPVAGLQYSVSVEIREFYGDGACNVSLRAAWMVKSSLAEKARAATAAPANAASASAAPVNPFPTIEDIQVPSSGSCPTTLAATMSVALGQLSDRIIAGVARMHAAAPAPATVPATTPAPGAAPAAR